MSGTRRVSNVGIIYNYYFGIVIWTLHGSIHNPQFPNQNFIFFVYLKDAQTVVVSKIFKRNQS